MAGKYPNITAQLLVVFQGFDVDYHIPFQPPEVDRTKFCSMLASTHNIISPYTTYRPNKPSMEEAARG